MIDQEMKRREHERKVREENSGRDDSLDELNEHLFIYSGGQRGELRPFHF